MKYSKDGLLHFKELKGLDHVLVTNTENGISAKFWIDELMFLGIEWLSIRVLKEISIGAAFSDDFYLLRYLKRKDIEWEKIKDGAEERKKYEKI